MAKGTKAAAGDKKAGRGKDKGVAGEATARVRRKRSLVDRLTGLVLVAFLVSTVVPHLGVVSAAG